jgi:hypothetical protein
MFARLLPIYRPRIGYQLVLALLQYALCLPVCRRGHLDTNAAASYWDALVTEMHRQSLIRQLIGNYVQFEGAPGVYSSAPSDA